MGLKFDIKKINLKLNTKFEIRRKYYKSRRKFTTNKIFLIDYFQNLVIVPYFSPVEW